MGNVYPLGYRRPGTKKLLEELMAQPRTLLIDCRFKPTSPLPDWRQSALQAAYGNRYHWAGEYLGNLNFQGGPILLANPNTGVAGLRMYLGEGYDLVLLCACANYEACHLATIVALLRQALPEVEVVLSDPGPARSIKCLSIRPPYADWIVQAGRFLAAGLAPKGVENRTWSSRYRGPLLIHSSTTFEEDAFKWVARCPQLEEVVSLDPQSYHLGQIVGIVDLIDVVRVSVDPWFVGPYGFVLANARAFERAVPYRGLPSLFDVPVEDVPEAEEVMATGMVSWKAGA